MVTSKATMSSMPVRTAKDKEEVFISSTIEACPASGLLGGAGGYDEIGNEQEVSSQREELAQVVGPPSVVVELDQSAHYAHQGTAGDKSAGKQGTLLATGLVDLSILRTGSDKPVDGATHEEGDIEFHGDKHTQGKGKG